jgi:hypothetical protein
LVYSDRKRQRFTPPNSKPQPLANILEKRTTMTTQDVIELLKKGETEYTKTEYFSQLPGIYTFFFIGNTFPLIGSSVSKHQIIYVGKTESSQEKRDAKTHFTTGKQEVQQFENQLVQFFVRKKT